MKKRRNPGSTRSISLYEDNREFSRKGKSPKVKLRQQFYLFNREFSRKGKSPQVIYLR